MRRVATLVARGTRPEEVFAAVVEEVGRLLPVDLASMCRYESDGTLTFVAAWGRAGEHFPVGSRRMLGGNNLGTIVFETGRSARIDNYADSCSGTIGVTVREAGINSSLATPIMVEGHLWGLIAAGSIQKQPVPADTEERLASFTELVATAIANAESRAALAASRARIAAAADAARRRIERDLHDGIQQQLVSLLLQLRLAESSVPAELEEAGGRSARSRASSTGSSTSYGRSPAAFIRPSSPRQGSDRRCGRLPAVRRFRSSSAVSSSIGCRSRLRLRRTTSSPKRSRTPPSTRTPPKLTSRLPRETVACGFRFVTTASAARTLRSARAW